MTKKGAYILIVEDDVEIVRALQRGLETNGYKVFSTYNGEDALKAFAYYQFDLILLDLGLPDMSGLEICKEVREQSSLPIIIISVKDTERSKVEALTLCADDYIAKPFGMQEVLARIRVALLHSAQLPSTAETTFTTGPLKIDFIRRFVQVNGQEIDLTPHEYDLLKVLIINRNKIMTQQLLLSKVWGYSFGPHNLHVLINHLRKKIEPDPKHPRFIHTEHGVGYRFNSEE